MCYCKHKKLETNDIYEERNGNVVLIERVILCKKCGKAKDFFAYGKYHIKDWKRLS